MKILLAVLISTYSLIALAAEETPTKPFKSGVVICSNARPSQTGFELIRVRGKDKDYTGQVDNELIRYSGIYRPANSYFQFRAESLDSDGEVIEELLMTETQLLPGEFLHFRSSTQSTNFDVYCHYVQSL